MVRLRTHWRLIGVGSLALLAGSGLLAAQDSASCSLVRDAQGNLIVDPRCPQTATPNKPVPATPGSTPAPSAAQRFPFPEDAPPPTTTTTAPAAAPAASSPGGGSPSGQGAAATQGQAGTPALPAAKRFPFPGDSDPVSPGTNAVPVPGQPPLNDAGSSGSSSSSSGSSSSGSSSSSSSSSSPTGDTPKGDPDTDPDAAAAPRRGRKKLPAVPRLSPSEQEQEDVQIAGFYQNDGNFKGAYDRARDAVSLDAEDPAAHLALGDSARRLGKLDEAEKAYRQCLQLDPVPKQRKRAEQALKEMTGGG